MHESQAVDDADGVVPHIGRSHEGESALADAVRERAGIPDWLLIALGWLGTGLALSLSNLPFKLLLKESMGLSATWLAGFMAIANIPIYIKPIAGVMSDAVPFLGTRRRHYLLFSLTLAGVFWLTLALVPRTYQWLLWTYLTLNLFLTMNSTVLGGLMVEIGKRDGATGRLSAQRLGIVRFVEFIAGPLGGFLAKQAFVITGTICAALNWVLVPVFLLFLREPRTRRTSWETLIEVKRQTVGLFRSRTLWSAAGLVILVIAAPGFETPLLYFQKDTLKFDPQFIGNLAAVKAAFGMVGALIYSVLCRRLNLRAVLALSIVLHATLTLFYLAYRSPLSAIIVTAIEGVTLVLALLPLYDLAARATPRGSEAVGYSLMMSVWNFTNAMADLFGSVLYDHWHLNFSSLIWVNSGTTALVLIAVPFLPAALMNRRDGDGSVGAVTPDRGGTAGPSRTTSG